MLYRHRYYIHNKKVTIMTKEKGRLGLLISALLTLVILGVAPAVAGATELVPPTNDPAHHTVPPTTPNDPSTDTNTVNPGGPNVPAGDTHTNTIPVVTSAQTQTKVNDLQQQGNTYLTQLRKHDENTNHQAQTQTAADRQKRCQSLQTMLNKQITKFSQNAQNHLTTFNSVLTKVQAYATKNNVSTTTYTSLVAAATTQQTNATQAVDALKSVSVTFNCTQQDPASSLSTIKAAVNSARTALQAYQKSIAAIISNLEASTKQ
jgi:hypothetical protein